MSNIDDSIRHAVTKLCHVHFVGNSKAKLRVINMGEKTQNVFQIGSADIDIMLSNKLRPIKKVKNITIFHLVNMLFYYGIQ